MEEFVLLFNSQCMSCINSSKIFPELDDATTGTWLVEAGLQLPIRQSFRILTTQDFSEWMLTNEVNLFHY